jgi:hypothetical protein
MFRFIISVSAIDMKVFSMINFLSGIIKCGDKIVLLAIV